MILNLYPLLDTVRQRHVGTVLEGRMTDDQWTIDIRISSIKSKLNHANYHKRQFLKSYDLNIFREEVGHELLRAEFYAYLNAVLGSLDLVLHEINILYRLGIIERRVNLSSVISALKSRETSEVSTRLQSIEKLDWYISLKDLRNKATHNPHMIWTLYIGGDNSGTITLPDDPFSRESSSSIEISSYLEMTLDETKAYIDSIQTIILRDL